MELIKINKFKTPSGEECINIWVDYRANGKRSLTNLSITKKTAKKLSKLLEKYK